MFISRSFDIVGRFLDLNTLLFLLIRYVDNVYSQLNALCFEISRKPSNNEIF